MFKIFTENTFVFNYRRMWPFIKPYRWRALLGILLTIPVGSLDAAIAAFLKPFIDNTIVHQNMEFSQKLPFIIVGFTLVQGILLYSANYVNTWVGAKMALLLKTKLFKHLLAMDSAYFDERQSGEIIFRYYNDADLATSGLVSNFKLFLTRFFSSLALLGVMIYNSWQMTLLTLGVFAFAVYPVKTVKRKIKAATERQVAASGHFLTAYNEAYSGQKIIKSFTLEDEFSKKAETLLGNLFTLMVKIVQGSGWFSPLLHLLGSVGIALVLWFGSRFIASGDMTVGSFVAFLGATIMLYTPLRSIGTNYVSVLLSFMAIDRVFEIFGTKSTITSSPDASELESFKSMEFKDVDFAYTPDVPVLKGLNFKVSVGQKIALVGNSGGGKTTISSLVARLYDVTGGEIHINGQNIKDYTVESLRRQVTMVFQDNVLFSGTVKDNLLLGKLNATEEEIWQALRNANLAEFISSTELGLETKIGERGILLSGGQKQRLAIARAFLKDSPLLILDEATSALDNKSEKLVQDALDRLMEHRTIIVIAHRLSTIRSADCIFVINDGEIVEAGTHSKLLAQGGAYCALYTAGVKSEEEDLRKQDNKSGDEHNDEDVRESGDGEPTEVASRKPSGNEEVPAKGRS